MKRVLLTIAGFDPCSGAGATLDLKVFSRFGFYGLAVLTSITVQNSLKVYHHLTLPPDLIIQQYRKLREDFQISGIKIGMLGSGQVIPAVARIVAENRKIPVVVDPVFRSTSGRWLIEKRYLQTYLKAIKGEITLITPNLDEATLILDKKIQNLRQMEESAKKISRLTDAACLLKGGHLKGQAVDVLYDGQQVHFIRKKKLPVEVHGTGCFLSSAILCFLAEGQTLSQACRHASLAANRHLRSPLFISQRPLLDL